MNFEQAYKKLSNIGQQHLLHFWKDLSASKQNSLLQEIENLNVETYLKQKQLIDHSNESSTKPIEPFLDFIEVGNKSDYETGLKLIADGQVGCLLVAGGQGTRLAFDGPKGLFPITAIRHKSLFQYFAEKVKAAGNRAKRLLPCAIMTSPINHKTTVQFFKKNHYFGLQEEQVSFFSQKMLPFLDQQKKLFLEEADRIAEGPDGNGSSLSHFFNSGLWNKWSQDGVKYLNYILVDNPLADPFDAELIGFHHRQSLEVTVKCVLRKDVEEKVGILVKSNGHVNVVEYSEFPEAEKKSLVGDKLKYPCANISLFCFSLDYIQKVQSVNLPLHLALKKAKNIENEDKAWKFETFIFDLLPYASKIKALLYPREDCFAPLKNSTGSYSPADVQRSLQDFDRRTFESVTGQPAPEHSFELDPQFYYPTPELIKKWKGKKATNQGYQGYIEG